MNQRVSIGRIVHYTISSVDSVRGCGSVRPAMVVRVVDEEKQIVNLQVFTDGGYDDLPSAYHAKNISPLEDEKKPQGRWFWPPYVPAKPGNGPKEEPKPKEELKKAIEEIFEQNQNQELQRRLAEIEAKQPPPPEPTVPEVSKKAPDGLPFHVTDDDKEKSHK